MRVIGLDLGTKRIGVAVSDRGGSVASPLLVIQRAKSRRADHAEIARIVREEEAEAVVVGLPLNMDGSRGPAAKAAVREAQVLATVVGVPVHTCDERRTTASADRVMLEAGLNAVERRRIVDKVAAAIILQHWLDGRSAS